MLGPLVILALGAASLSDGVDKDEPLHIDPFGNGDLVYNIVYNPDDIELGSVIYGHVDILSVPHRFIAIKSWRNQEGIYEPVDDPFSFLDKLYNTDEGGFNETFDIPDVPGDWIIAIFPSPVPEEDLGNFPSPTPLQSKYKRDTYPWEGRFSRHDVEDYLFFDRGPNRVPVALFRTFVHFTALRVQGGDELSRLLGEPQKGARDPHDRYNIEHASWHRVWNKPETLLPVQLRPVNLMFEEPGEWLLTIMPHRE